MSVAIVGSGLAGFTAYATLRHGGLEPGEIVVFGMADDPAAAWRLRAAAIRQREMRSESDGHCLPTSFPGLAVRAAVRRRSAGAWPPRRSGGTRSTPAPRSFPSAAASRCGGR